MSGYAGFSKSNNALNAESEDRFPLTQAAKVLAKKIGWTVQKAKAFLLAQGTSEWHHCSKKYNVVDYYKVSDDHLADINEELKSFQYEYEKTPKKEKTLLFKCWNFERASNDPRKLQWSITNRVGNSTHSLESVKNKMLSVQAVLQRDHVAGHKTSDRLFAENMQAIAAILAAID